MKTSTLGIHIILSIGLLVACSVPAVPTAIAPPPTTALTTAATTAPTQMPIAPPTKVPTPISSATPAPKPTASDIPLPTKIPQPTGEPTAVAALTGVYTNYLTLADVKDVSHLDMLDCAYIGPYTLTLTAVTWKLDHTVPTNVSAKVSGGCPVPNFITNGPVLLQPIRITMTDEFDLGVVANCTATHTYTWSMAGSKLTLRTATDKCVDAITIFSTHP